MAIGTTIKTIQDIMRKDAGVDGDAQRISQLVWMIFLKVFDASLLPYTYVGAAVVAPLVSSAFLRLQRRLSFTSLLIVTLLGDAAALALGPEFGWTTSSVWV